MSDQAGFDTWAPPAAAFVRDFVNTYEPQQDAESLTGPAELRAWFAAHDVVAPDARLTGADLHTVRRVRAGVRALLLGHAGHTADPAELGDLNSAIGAVPVYGTFGTDSGLRLRSPATPLGQCLAALLDAIRRCEAEGHWHRLKACDRETCRWAFYDASRNHARRWCSMAGCGNYVKMRRSAARRSGAARPDS